MKLADVVPDRLRGPVAAVWIAGVALWTLPSLRWQLDYYKNPGPQFYKGILIVAPLVFAAALAYARLRTPTLRKLEPWALLAFPAALAAREPVACLACMLIVVSCFCMGRKLLEGCRLDQGPAVERDLLAATAGLAAWSSALFCLGMAGLLNVWLLAALIGAPIIVWRRFLVELRETFRDCAAAWRTDSEFAHPLIGVAYFFALLSAISATALLAAPPVAFDAVNFHLPLAKTYAEMGRLVSLKSETYSYFPQGFELLLTNAYLFGGVKAAQFFGVIDFFLALGLAWRTAERCGLRRGATALGLGAAACAPAFHAPAFTAKNDMATAAYLLAGLLALLLWTERRGPGWPAAAVGFVGASFATKHTALFSAAAVGVFFLYAFAREPKKLRLLAVSVLLWMLTAGIWHVRAYALTGSPVYPYGVGLLAKNTLNGYSEERSNKPPPSLLTAFPETFADAHLRGYLVYESILPAPLGLFLAMFLPLPLLYRRKPSNRAIRLLGLGVAATLVLWIATMAPLRGTIKADVTVRYVHAAFLLWFVLLAPAVWRCCEKSSRWVCGAILAGVAYSFLLCWTGLLIIENSGAQVNYLLGRMSEADYIDGAQGPYAVIQAVAKAAPPGTDILAVGACASLYYPEPWRFECSRGQRDAEYVRRKFAAKDYGFLILDRAQSASSAGLPTPVKPFYQDERYEAFRAR